jgi:hypothetical protein
VSPYDDEFFADLAPLLGDLKLAKFLGGEPFLAPEHKRVWSMMDDLDHPPRMQVTTNGTVWNDYVAWLLERFEVDISVSIDATTAATYAEVRRSDQFDRLMENLERFDEVCRRKGTDLHVSFCLMNRNAHEVADFLAWADRFDVPASINLVTDDELALHDAPLAELEAIGRAWAADDRRIGERFGKNDGVWRTQLAQMKSVIAERRAGIEPSPRQARRADGSVITPRPGAPAPRWRTRRPRQRADEATAGHVGRLRRWSEDGPVGRVDVDASGIIRAVPLAHEPLGIDADLCGRHVSEIVGVLEVRSGRPAWLVESADDGDESVRSIVLSETQPLRGTTGRVVRTIQQSVPGGSRILVAEDLLYEPARAGTPVALRVGSGAP